MKCVPRDVNYTFLDLIPKIGEAKSFSDYRPISLCNTIYKIFSKIVANKLKEFLPIVIDKQQRAFVHGRQILDGIISIHKIIHSIVNARKEVMFLKLDMNKAYDRVSWSFLLSVLRRFGFGEDWVSLVEACISPIMLSELVNGSAVSYFPSKHGLR